MAGRGKVGKPSSKAGAKRHEKKLPSGNSTITMGGIRRLARRGGVKRISSSVYD